MTASNRLYGIYLIGGGQDVTLTGNTLTNDGTAIVLESLSDGPDSDSAPFSGWGNVFTGSTNGLNLGYMTTSGNVIVIGNAIAAGVNFVVDGNSGFLTLAGTAISLNNVRDVTIDGLDVSYRDLTRSGYGIQATNSSDNLVVKNVTASNRQTGLEFNPYTGTTNPTYLVRVQDSNFLNNDTGLYLVQYNAGGYVHNSRIEGNGTALSYSTFGGTTPAPVTLDATGNYWGPGGGPGVGGNNGVTSYPYGTVDASGSISAVPAALARDFGDALVSYGYATTLLQFGARHVAGGPILGSARDVEIDGAPSPTAMSDDAGATDDEDGVTIGPLVPGQTGTATVVVSNAPSGAKLDAWIDFNADGDWDDAGEQVAASASVVNGTNTITFAVPPGAAISLNYARFRLSTIGGLTPYGRGVGRRG